MRRGLLNASSWSFVLVMLQRKNILTVLWPLMLIASDCGTQPPANAFLNPR
ncbi:MAG TPA: hypothetical protein VFP91_05170 [Vicinamibacterales bacterium]|nr:hypothetical protein [Vicinamibacterales bacterium]